MKLVIVTLLVVSLQGCVYIGAPNDPSLPSAIFFAAFVFGAIGAVGASMKGRSTQGWFHTGFWLGPLAFLVFFLNNPQVDRKQSNSGELAMIALGIALLISPIFLLKLIDMDYESGRRAQYERDINAAATLREQQAKENEDRFWREAAVQAEVERRENERREQGY